MTKQHWGKGIGAALQNEALGTVSHKVTAFTHSKLSHQNARVLVGSHKLQCCGKTPPPSFCTLAAVWQGSRKLVVIFVTAKTGWKFHFWSDVAQSSLEVFAVCLPANAAIHWISFFLSCVVCDCCMNIWDLSQRHAFASIFFFFRFSKPSLTGHPSPPG